MKLLPVRLRITLGCVILFGIVILLDLLLDPEHAIAETFFDFSPGVNVPSTPTPVPAGYQAPGYRTPTVDRHSPKYTPFPTGTPIKYMNTVDLSPGLKDEEKFEVVIRHADTSLDRYFIGPLPENADLSRGLPQKIIQGLPLKPGDKIWAWKPPLPYRMVEPTKPPTDPPLPELSKQPISTGIANPYPAP